MAEDMLPTPHRGGVISLAPSPGTLVRYTILKMKLLIERRWHLSEEAGMKISRFPDPLTWARWLSEQTQTS
jgi:hypothetical protein